MTDKKWNKFHRRLKKEYPTKSEKQLDAIEAGIKRRRGWKPKKRKGSRKS